MWGQMIFLTILGVVNEAAKPAKDRFGGSP